MPKEIPMFPVPALEVHCLNRAPKTKLFYQLDLLENHIDKYDFKMINIYNNQIYPPGIMTEINFGVDGLIRSVMRSSISVGIKKEKMIGENIYNFTNVQNQY